MDPKIIIRHETKQDIEPITQVTTAAFAQAEHTSKTEQFIVLALRDAGALTISLVAELNEKIIGHIGFSPILISDGTEGWYGLAPVSVDPEYQRKGVGKALIRRGLLELEEMKAGGCCLVGHPEYYTKFGFRNVEGLVYEGVPEEVFFALSFGGEEKGMPQGKVTFHEAFGADGK